MVSISYSEAAVEVLDILDHTKEIKDIELKSETQAILGLIYMKYWANEEEKEKFKENESLTQVEHKTFLQKIIDKIENIFWGYVKWR